MEYVKNIWKDRNVERPNTYTEVTNIDGTKTFTASPGVITESGTPITAEKMNNIENALEKTLFFNDETIPSVKIMPVYKNGFEDTTLQCKNFIYNKYGYYLRYYSGYSYLDAFYCIDNYPWAISGVKMSGGNDVVGCVLNSDTFIGVVHSWDAAGNKVVMKKYTISKSGTYNEVPDYTSAPTVINTLASSPLMGVYAIDEYSSYIIEEDTGNVYRLDIVTNNNPVNVTYMGNIYQFLPWPVRSKLSVDFDGVNFRVIMQAKGANGGMRVYTVTPNSVVLWGLELNNLFTPSTLTEIFIDRATGKTYLRDTITSDLYEIKYP